MIDIVIIEDEKLTAEDLKDNILQADPSANVLCILTSVKEAIHYFNNNPMPQLIFSDIQLGDGLSFDIFENVQVTAPIIFCTAYDEYAMKAFDTNGIHYILKPFDENKVAEALKKHELFKNIFIKNNYSIEKLISELRADDKYFQNKKSKSVLVYFQNSVIPVKLENIAVFYIKNDTTHLITFDQQVYVVNRSLDELQQLDEELFYRANRQFIINKNAIKEAQYYQSRKVSILLNIPFDETITISKEKVTHFFNWLT